MRETDLKVLREVQEALRPYRPTDGSSVVDSLIQERRLEAAREDEEMAKPIGKSRRS